MEQYTLQKRAQFYANQFPKWPAPRADNRWIDGMWILGNDYKGSGYYGSYPPNYVKRVVSMFPDAQRILHLFSGSLPAGNYTRFDCNQELNPDVFGDAETLSAYFEPNSFDLILADPPYSEEDAKHYGKPMISRNKVLKECANVLEPGGFIIWLDQVLPMFRKDELLLCGVIGIVRSTNHRFRVSCWFKKIEELQRRKYSS
jgi:SAM-dependent methyltransferase